jgi:predicted aminopeptidase
MKKRWLLLGAIGVLVAVAGGCATLQYYGQAISGHLSVMQRAESIADRVADPATPPVLRDKLARVLEIREFASRELALPNNGSYRKYADVERPFVVWNVFAAPELSVEPKQSCFAIVGCVGYRGYYSQAEAESYAAAARTGGDDVFVYGVTAYSTLGWFDDPVLSTFVRYPMPEIARLVFHELAHQVVYVKGDTTFNESFAVAVEEEGIRRWMGKHATDDEQRLYADGRRYRADFVRLVLAYRERAVTLYSQPLAIDAKRAAKRALFEELVRDYERLKMSWGGFAGYDRFFAGIGNAHLASIATYEQLVPAFRALLVREGGDFAKFYTAVQTLAQLDKRVRDARLAALADSAQTTTLLR